MMNNAVEIRDLVVVRGGRTVLPGFSASVGAGSVTGLLGPSGCGKTTLLRAIVGTQRIRSGTVTVLGLPAGCRELRSRVGYVTQAPSVYLDLRVRENLAYFAALVGAGAAEVDAALRDVGLADRGDDLVGQLSGGQRARVSLAAALLSRPDVLILDEPTVGLDPVLRRDLWAMFGALAAAGATLLVSSHVMDEAERCQRLLLMREGHLLADASPEELCTRTGTGDVEAAFLALVEQSVAREGVPA
jgi:ABC-2 type transport system ATP-binding protein